MFLIIIKSKPLIIVTNYSVESRFGSLRIPIKFANLKCNQNTVNIQNIVNYNIANIRQNYII